MSMAYKLLWWLAVWPALIVFLVCGMWALSGVALLCLCMVLADVPERIAGKLK